MRSKNNDIFLQKFTMKANKIRSKTKNSAINTVK